MAPPMGSTRPAANCYLRPGCIGSLSYIYVCLCMYVNYILSPISSTVSTVSSTLSLFVVLSSLSPLQLKMLLLPNSKCFFASPFPLGIHMPNSPCSGIDNFRNELNFVSWSKFVWWLHVYHAPGDTSFSYSWVVNISIHGNVICSNLIHMDVLNFFLLKLHLLCYSIIERVWKDFSLIVHGWIILIDLQISSYLGLIVERYEILVDFGEEIRKGWEFRAEKRMVPFVIFFFFEW